MGAGGGGVPAQGNPGQPPSTGCQPSRGLSPAPRAWAPACPGGTLLRLTRGPGDP